jgi:hypothetical protein
VELAFGRRPLEFVERAVQLPTAPAADARQAVGERDFFWQATALGTRRVRRGPVTEVVEQPAGLDRCRC